MKDYMNDVVLAAQNTLENLPPFDEVDSDSGEEDNDCLPSDNLDASPQSSGDGHSPRVNHSHPDTNTATDKVCPTGGLPDFPSRPTSHKGTRKKNLAENRDDTYETGEDEWDQGTKSEEGEPEQESESDQEADPEYGDALSQGSDYTLIFR